MQMTENDLQSLLDNSVVESKLLEYKKELNISRDQEKKEFLADISSFANSIGGQIIFGVTEDSETGKPKEITGIEVQNVDQEILRMQNLINSGLEPRLIGVEIESVSLSNAKHAFVVSIPNSWNSPHRVIFGNHGHFYIRDTNGKHQLDVSELKVAFALSATIAEKIKRFREERIASIIVGETPVDFIDNPGKVLFHLIPLNSFGVGISYDVKQALNSIELLAPIYCGGWSPSFNFDGCISFAQNRDSISYSYVQFYKNGIIEALQGDFLTERDQQKYIYPFFTTELLRAQDRYVNLLRKLNVELPIFALLTFIGCKGFTIPQSGHSFDRDITKISRDILYFPEVLIEDLDTPPHVYFRPIFDALWNACGYSQCPYYDINGSWIDPR